MTTLESEAPPDEVGWRLRAELQRDARLSYSELGRRVGLSPPAVIERLRRMEATGLITGYRAQVDLHKLGLPVQAIIRLSTGEGGCARFVETAKKFPEILECHRVTGGDSYVMKVAVASVGHLESLLDRLSPHGVTTTSVVLSTPVGGRVIEPLLGGNGASGGNGLNGASANGAGNGANGRARKARA